MNARSVVIHRRAILLKLALVQISTLKVMDGIKMDMETVKMILQAREELLLDVIAENLVGLADLYLLSFEEIKECLENSIAQNTIVENL
jgi:hypothetical protein